MNIFDQYLDKIKKILLELSKNGNIILPDNLDNITTEIPPTKFNSDISTNVAMVLSKVNKKSPLDLANILVESIKKNDELIDEVKVVKPGFINIKFKSIFWTNFIKEVIKNYKIFGINTKEEKKKLFS
jgi:arginyl-tRNA synthetase